LAQDLDIVVGAEAQAVAASCARGGRPRFDEAAEAKAGAGLEVVMGTVGLPKGGLDRLGVLNEIPLVDHGVAASFGVQFLAELGIEFDEHVEWIALEHVLGLDHTGDGNQVGRQQRDLTDIGIDEAGVALLSSDVSDGFGDVSRDESRRVRSSVGQAPWIIERGIAEHAHPNAGEMVLKDDFIGLGEKDDAADDASGVGGHIGGDAGDVGDSGGGEGEGVGRGGLEDGVLVEVRDKDADFDGVTGTIGGLAGDGADPDPGMGEVGGRRHAVGAWRVGEDDASLDDELQLQTLVTEDPTTDHALEFDPEGIVAARKEVCGGYWNGVGNRGRPEVFEDLLGNGVERFVSDGAAVNAEALSGSVTRAWIFSGKDINTAGGILDEKSVPLRFVVGDDAGDDGGKAGLGEGGLESADGGDGIERGWIVGCLEGRGSGADGGRRRDLSGSNGGHIEGTPTSGDPPEEEERADEGTLVLTCAEPFAIEALAWLGRDEAVPRDHAVLF